MDIISVPLVKVDIMHKIDFHRMSLWYEVVINFLRSFMKFNMLIHFTDLSEK